MLYSDFLKCLNTSFINKMSSLNPDQLHATWYSQNCSQFVQWCSENSRLCHWCLMYACTRPSQCGNGAPSFQFALQHAGECFDDYIMDLRGLAKTCDFCDTCEESLIPAHRFRSVIASDMPQAQVNAVNFKHQQKKPHKQHYQQKQSH